MSSLKDYQILAKIGQGSFGVVYKVKNKQDKEVYVLKQINMTKMDQRMKSSTLTEAKILKDIKSPYIVRYYDSFLEKSILNIIMEYCPGGDIAGLIKGMMGRPIKEDKIWKLFIEMCIGLRDIHAKRILHRDIKSLNIFIAKDQSIRIGDLGVAKEMNNDFAHTIVGTPYYLSPEMCEEKPYNQKTDIWAIGCVLYQLCTGKHPFQANNQAALALKIVMGKYSPIPSIYSLQLVEMVSQCLSTDHKRRPSAQYILSKPVVIEKIKSLKIYNSKGQQQSIVPKDFKQIQKLPKEKSKQRVSSSIEKKNNQQIIPQIVLNSVQISAPKWKKPNSVEKKQPEIKPLRINNPIKPPLPRQSHQQKQQSGIAKNQNINKEAQMRRQKEKKQQEQKRKIKEAQQMQKKISEKLQQKKMEQKRKELDEKFKEKQKPKQELKLKPKVIQDFERSKERFKDQQHIQQKRLPDDLDSQDDQKKYKNRKLVKQIQQIVDDDEIERQFGISSKPKEKIIIPELLLKEPKQIKWQLEQRKSQQQLPSFVGESTDISEPMLNHQSSVDIQEQIDDNEPFRSSEQASQVEEEQQNIYLIEDYMKQEKLNLQRMLEENEKRRKQFMYLIQAKEEQICAMMPKSEYLKLKELAKSGDDKEIEKLSLDKNLVKNKTCMYAFYKIVQFEIQIETCDSRINTINMKLKEIQFKDFKK